MAASVSPLCSSFKLSSSVLQPSCHYKFRIFRKCSGLQRCFHQSAFSQTAMVISGKELARQIHKEVQCDVEEWVSFGNKQPHLSVIVVGDNPASHTYVRNKTRAAAALEHINERAVCNAVAPEKDVDGFHIVNIGKLCLDQKSMVPATPAAVWEIIKRTEIQTVGRNVVVAGRSKNVGMPIAMLLHTDGRHERPGGDATVTIAHRCTPREKLKELTRLADIVIAAAGIPHLITADMVKEGATVIDVGINHIQDSETGKIRLVGDVDFEEVRKRAGFITPVPGGVGPVTVAMLMKNTVTAARNTITH
ncbi:bifunctional methylenetetrahydrofolate dehydrogenase/cyclohydrolase 2, mitochondrial-like isoform X4 [Paramormyrops kingsleyae]|uniref:bifunctional methylenetetrahydrofolate dehydrogenase/cyclohydrolase 2, mitochondrial-like isoform X4 n=1 Tax=Paramormyrops kingsleyae TaxID=1676925 RepID=UPI000CD62625|nr:probable bifunctional methylenetetrahydrofolate dehydrogenase/cyclohydrolase 2 isoform X2 [Paramormyrops kingsleyae]